MNRINLTADDLNNQSGNNIGGNKNKNNHINNMNKRE
jgi:hypothetical protein